MICALGCLYNELIDAWLVYWFFFFFLNFRKVLRPVMLQFFCGAQVFIYYVLCDLAAAPHLTEKPQDVQKRIDDTLVWECKASAKPKPSYRWLKNGEPLDHMEVTDFFLNPSLFSFWPCNHENKITIQACPPTFSCHSVKTQILTVFPNQIIKCELWLCKSPAG